MTSWEVVQSAFIALIFLFFFIGFNIADDKKYVVFKVFFLWFGLTLISPFLLIQYLISNEHLTAVADIYKIIFLGYLPIYLFFVWVLYLAFFKDILIFFKNSINGKFSSDEESETIPEA